MRFAKRDLSFRDVSGELPASGSRPVRRGHTQRFLIDGTFQEREVAGWETVSSMRIPVPKTASGEQLKVSDSGWTSQSA